MGTFSWIPPLLRDSNTRDARHGQPALCQEQWCWMRTLHLSAFDGPDAPHANYLHQTAPFKLWEEFRPFTRACQCAYQPEGLCSEGLELLVRLNLGWRLKRENSLWFCSVARHLVAWVSEGENTKSLLCKTKICFFLSIYWIPPDFYECLWWYLRLQCQHIQV